MRTVLTLLVVFFASQAFGVPQIITQPEVAWQGKVLRVKLMAAEGVKEVSGRFVNRKFPCYKKGDDYVGIIGVPINQKVGHYNLELIVTYNDGQSESITKKMKLWETKFPFSRYWLRPARNKLRARQTINNEWARVEKVLIIKGSEKQWSGKFIKPIDSFITQGFGHRQIINGKRSGNHRGMDLRAKIGTKVLAPNKGKIVFADTLKAFGGTLVLDHGQGIHTLYFHLSKFKVTLGQTVKKGEIIALSGNSGISSGPHLHWGMSVHNLRVDPLQWTKYEL